MDASSVPKMTVATLRKELEARSCDTSGLKAVLVKRLQAAILADAKEEPAAAPPAASAPDLAKPAPEPAEPAPEPEPAVAAGGKRKRGADDDTDDARAEAKTSSTSTAGGADKVELGPGASEIVFATVCSSNVNRSTEAHALLAKHGLKCASFGIGSRVRLPGKTRDDGSTTFDFGTPYDTIYETLKNEDEAFFTERGLLAMMDRNRKLKKAPQRWQDTEDINQFAVVVCFEQRVFDILVEDVQQRDAEDFVPIHIVNLDTHDSPAAAKIASKICLQFCVDCCKNRKGELDTAIPALIAAFEKQNKLHMNHCVALI